ncbi:hypothetical protein D9M68_808790 [compost metagenome]
MSEQVPARHVQGRGQEVLTGNEVMQEMPETVRAIQVVLLNHSPFRFQQGNHVLYRYIMIADCCSLSVTPQCCDTQADAKAVLVGFYTF